MDAISKKTFADLWSTDRQVQYHSFQAFLEITDQPVDWAYEFWDDLLARLAHKDNHVARHRGSAALQPREKRPKGTHAQGFACLAGCHEG